MRSLLKLGCLLMVLLYFPIIGLAQTQEEWNLSCTYKTATSTTVYRTDAKEEIKEIIPANTYVKIKSDGADGLCVINYMVNGAKSTGLVLRSNLIRCTSSYRKSDGWAENVHELAPEHDKILESHAVILVAPSLLQQGDKDYSDLDFELPDSPSAHAAQQTAGRGEKVEAEKPAATTAPMQAANKNSGKTSTSTTTNSAEKQEEAAEATVQIGLVQLGTHTSVVEYEGREVEVPTAELLFSADAPADKQVAYIHAPRTGKCSLRAKASDNAQVLVKCKAGTVVQVVSYGKNYCRIVYDGQVGYVQTSCLKFLDTAAEPMCTWQLSYNGKTTGSAQVPIRNAADNDSSIIVKLRSGTEVTVFAKTGKWYEVEYEGMHGYVHQNFLRIEDVQN